MSIITYTKGLPTPELSMNPLGFTDFEMFLNAFSPIFKNAVCETVDKILASKNFEKEKGKFNTHLQQKYGLSKRHSTGVITLASSKVDSASECRANHIKQLEGKLKSAKIWLKNALKRLSDSQKFYALKNWQKSKTGCKVPLACDLSTQRSNWHSLKFQIHNKKRYVNQLEKKITHLKTACLRVKVSNSEIYIVGSKDESFGNQVCQYDGNKICFRVPYCLEKRFGKYIGTLIGNFDRNINRLPQDGAKTWHFFKKNGRWVVAVQFTPAPVEKVSKPIEYGAIGIDINPSSIGWTYVDTCGNLKEFGTIPLQSGLGKNFNSQQIVNTCLELALLATKYACPIVCEELDFRKKKESLREKGRKYARMLSSFAYSKFYQYLTSILSNRGISLYNLNPAYTSLIGLVKYSRMYGLSSDIAAALVIARRGMNLSEKLPVSTNAYLGVNPRKHVWSGWSKLNKLTLTAAIIKSRHDYFSIPNWGMVVKVQVEQVTVKRERRACSKSTL
jgi:IS605 OrfB family transposase